jgi:hypothetical protein
MKRLAEIMPKDTKLTTVPDLRKKLWNIDIHPIRQSAEAFASWLGDDLPANSKEVRAMLWTYGTDVERLDAPSE